MPLIIIRDDSSAAGSSSVALIGSVSAAGIVGAILLTWAIGCLCSDSDYLRPWRILRRRWTRAPQTSPGTDEVTPPMEEQRRLPPILIPSTAPDSFTPEFSTSDVRLIRTPTTRSPVRSRSHRAHEDDCTTCRQIRALQERQDDLLDEVRVPDADYAGVCGDADGWLATSTASDASKRLRGVGRPAGLGVDDARARGRRRQEGGAREPRRSDLRPRPAKRDCEDRPQHSRAPGSRYVRANSGAAIAARLRRAPRREREAPTGSCGAQSTPARRTRESRRPPRRSAGREREPNRPGRPHRSPGRCTPPPGRGRR